MPIRIGAVSYLNTKPLIYGLQELLPQAELVLDLPSRLADRLSSGNLDVALIPSVEFLRGHDLSIVSDACIACRGPVRSVRVLFRTHPSQVATLALDEGSRTSAALAQVLLAQRFGIRPQLSPLGIDASFDSIDADALVVIGDRAMQIDTTAYVDSWDLGCEWNRQTGLPFVFAMWVTNHQALPFELSQALQTCRDNGLAHLQAIVAEQAPRYHLTALDCEIYFQEQLHFYLGSRELSGLELFRTQATQLGLVPATSTHLSLQPI